MVFHNKSVVKKRKERNFNLTKYEYIPIQILQIIFTFNNISPECITCNEMEYLWIHTKKLVK